MKRPVWRAKHKKRKTEEAEAIIAAHKEKGREKETAQAAGSLVTSAANESVLSTTQWLVVASNSRNILPLRTARVV